MKDKKLEFYTITSFIFMSYFFITTGVFIFSYISGNEGISIPLFGGGDDGTFYWGQAINYAEGKPWIRTSIYPEIIGNIIKIIGVNSVYFIRLFNYIGFMLLLFVVYRLIDIQFAYDKNIINRNIQYNSKIFISILFLFYVSLQMTLNLSIFRDIWIYLLYSLSIYLSIKLIIIKKNKLLYSILLVPTLLLLGEFRKYAMLAFFFTTFTYISFKQLNKFFNYKVISLISIVLFSLYYTFFLNFTIMGMSLGGALLYRQSALDLYSGGSQMWISLNQPNFILFLLNYVHSYMGNFIGPLPWHISSATILFVFFTETIPMVFILNFIWNQKKFLSQVQRYILLHSIVWISLIGFTNDNVGTASRLRPVAWILILTVFVVNYIKYKSESY